MPRPKNTSVLTEMNARTFDRADNARKNPNVRRNQLALKRMSKAERETGLTAEQLAEIQRRLREDFYARSAA